RLGPAVCGLAGRVPDRRARRATALRGAAGLGRAARLRRHRPGPEDPRGLRPDPGVVAGRRAGAGLDRRPDAGATADTAPVARLPACAAPGAVAMMRPEEFREMLAHALAVREEK